MVPRVILVILEYAAPLEKLVRQERMEKRDPPDRAAPKVEKVGRVKPVAMDARVSEAMLVLVVAKVMKGQSDHQAKPE